MNKEIVAVPYPSFYEISEDKETGNKVPSKQPVAYPMPISQGTSDQMVTGGISTD